MAYPQARSCNTELRAGATDGSWKKYAPNRGGTVELTTEDNKERMSGVWHGFNMCSTMTMPDGTVIPAPYYVDITPEDVENV